VNGIDLGDEYRKLYSEYSRLYDAKHGNLVQVGWYSKVLPEGKMVDMITGKLDCDDVAMYIVTKDTKCT